MANTNYIQTGLRSLWYDYDRPILSRLIIVVDNNTSRYLTSWIAVILGLSIPCAYVIFRRVVITTLPALWRGLAYIFNLLFRRGSRPGTPEAEDILLDDRSVIQKTIVQFQKTGDEDNPFKAIRRVATGISEHSRIRLEPNPEDPGNPEGNDLRRNPWQQSLNSLKKGWSALQTLMGDPGLGLAVLLVICFFSALLVGGAYISVISADIAGGSTVLSANPFAGYWVSDTSSAAFLLGDGAVISENRQARTWAYRESCYGADEGDPACNEFYKQQIPFSAFSNASCPFDGDACLFGRQSAFEVSTGLLDSNFLGVNAPRSKRFYFSRTMSCAPLHADEQYVKPTGGPQFPNEYEYYYGPFVLGPYILANYTYANDREWSSTGGIPEYTLAPSLYDPVREIFSTFDPLPEFRAGNKTVTLMFISTGGTHLHVFERDDPIFPAHNAIWLRIGPGTLSTFWYNNSTRAGVLGCVDSHKICADQEGSLCWDQSNSTEALHHFRGDVQRQRALFLVLISMIDSNAWHVVNYRRSAALNATSKIKRVIGIRLAEEQWKVEVENIFSASLAGMQIRAYDYALGTYAHHPNMIDLTPAWLGDNSTNLPAAVHVSEMFKFNSNAVTDVSAVGFWGINLLCILLFLGSRRFSNHERRLESIREHGSEGYHDNLWATIAWKVFIWRPVKAVAGWMQDGIWAAYPKVVDAFQRLTGRGEDDGGQTSQDPNNPSEDNSSV